MLRFEMRDGEQAGSEPIKIVVRKGRGAASNIPHRFESLERLPDGDALDAARLDSSGDDEPLALLATSTTLETANTLITYNESPDIGFDRSLNPYRGCEHGCIYCFARPTHSYLNLSPGLDFETRLVAKENAAELLTRELAAASYKPEVIAVGVITDAYQPIERELRITRAIVEILAHTRHPGWPPASSSDLGRSLRTSSSTAGPRVDGASSSGAT